MAKRRTKRKYTLRSPDQRIADLERRIDALKATAKEREEFSAEAVKKHRARLGLSVKAYAELVGVSPITIYSWEGGRRAPRDVQLDMWLRLKAISKEAAWKKLGIEEIPEFNGKAVVAERKRLGLSAAKYGELVGVSVLTIYNWENGVSSPRGRVLEKWLAIRGIGKAKAHKLLGLA